MPIYSDRETLSRIQMNELQWERLKQTIEHAYHNVPFYRESFNQIHITPADIKSLNDLPLLPFTKKQHLRENYPFNLLACPMEDVVRIHASSGTSGKPTVVAYTKSDIRNWGDIVARAISLAGGGKGDILHNAYGYGLFTGGLGLHAGSEQLGCATVPISGGNTANQITLIQDFKPAIICSTPSYLLNIGETMMQQGIDPASTSLKYAILGAEPWSEEMRFQIEKLFNLKAMDIYGLSEVMGPGIAMECVECQDGLHIADDHFLVEVINPDTLEPVEDGTDGELVFTSLTKEALPTIRYRTGDIASITREPCRCGRTTTRMSRVKGRIDDMLIIRGVNVFPSEIERYICNMEELVPHYQIHLQKKGYLDHVELHVEVCQNYYESLPEKSFNHPIAAELINRIAKTLKMKALISVDVLLKEPQGIPRSEGKAKRVFDNRAILSTL
ncbi:AMP-binding protein [Pseudalkalibacillus hwajinpoensis]|uniref:Phenylacetate-coenzyme A ligase n=1 Tax=Guptibacillus hwajinpoensis TaxID=208199 RepID=A0A4U1MJ41_9BACL|nr:AMP-binding protein [Pseudalkalibacillus hwajinpoensis]TKD70827.1 phenylacetate--CoA ligase [Pseudalkalibacillus hwajinpoensis]